MSPFRIVKANPGLNPEVAETICKMHEACFEGLPFREFHGDWFLALNPEKVPVAFAGLHPSARPLRL